MILGQNFVELRNCYFIHLLCFYILNIIIVMFPTSWKSCTRWFLWKHCSKHCQLSEIFHFPALDSYNTKNYLFRIIKSSKDYILASFSLPVCSKLCNWFLLKAKNKIQVHVFCSSEPPWFNQISKTKCILDRSEFY